MIGVKRRRGATDVLDVGGRSVRLTPSKLIGSGGEAEVFDIGGKVALKRFKRAAHPDYAHDAHAQRAAEERIRVQQAKLPALMQLALPQRVVAPLAVARDGSEIAGYTMQLVAGAEPLLRYGDRVWRQQAGVTSAHLSEVLRDLHATVEQLHQRSVVIGDFNDLNVLVAGSSAWVIDADSMQFGGFASNVFTVRFLDPRITNGYQMLPARPHDELSDWYAFAVMTFQQLLLVDPYGGIYKPPAGAARIAHDDRPLQLISVFNPHVKVPKQAVRFDTLPDDLLQHFTQMFDRGVRGAFPRLLLDRLQWTRCACGLEHARSQCPVCATAAPRVARPTLVARGRVSAKTLLQTNGVVVAAQLAGDRLLWLEHRDDAYVREDGMLVFEGPLDRRFSFALQPHATIVTRGDETLVFSNRGVDRQRLSLVRTNAQHRYWVDDGTLFRDGSFAPEPIGQILGGQTQFWVGPDFGFGFYRASELTIAFTFDAESRGLRDDVKLPRLGGQVIAADAVFAGDRCWFFVATQENGRISHRCTVIRRDGSVEATREAAPSDGDWLARVHGNAAAGRVLFVATDDGIARVEPENGALAVTATFPDTEGFVDAGTRLFATSNGLIAVSAQRIELLTM